MVITRLPAPKKPLAHDTIFMMFGVSQNSPVERLQAESQDNQDT